MYAETRLDVTAENSPLIYHWKGYGLTLQFPEETKASLRLKVVSSCNFELPEGTELVSPVYSVSCEGKVGGPVGVELQHCARAREEGQHSGLKFVVCKAEPPYKFELVEGLFSSSSSYGRMEVKFSGKYMAVVRWILGWPDAEQSTADLMFLAKLYYHQYQQSKATVHVVIVPKVDASNTVSEIYKTVQNIHFAEFNVYRSCSSVMRTELSFFLAPVRL